MFDIEFGDCDETLHPYCEGVECETVLLVTGSVFDSLQAAEGFAQDVLYDRVTAAELLEAGDPGWTAHSLMTAGRDPRSVVLRDFNVADHGQPAGEQGYTYVAGGHDEMSLIEGD